jgi:hypothetical protein
MRDGTSATEDAKSAGMSPLRLRLGALLIILWLLPFWALAPEIAHFLRGSVTSISCGCHDNHRRRADHYRVARIVDRRNGSQVDHQGLHDEACPEGRLVNTSSRRDPA